MKKNTKQKSTQLKKNSQKKIVAGNVKKKYHWLEDLIANVAMYFAAHIVFLTFMNVILTINLHSKRNWMQ